MRKNIETKLSFKIQDKGAGGTKDPRWREVETENTVCPVGHGMVVILGHKSLLYAYCPECKKYYLGE